MMYTIVDPEIPIDPQATEDLKKNVRTFITNHLNNGISRDKFVFITSGGTRIPLEKKPVRFVDNFSRGTRGASSAEKFLDAGHPVIYLYRETTLQPFLRHFDTMDKIISPPETIVQSYKKHKSKLLLVTFAELAQYLHYLHVISLIINELVPKCILYLAAAVSDFYLPQEKMSSHKIESSEPLNLKFENVPKFLRPLVKSWAPEAFVVSFKLETEFESLIPKARKALQTYGHKLVIANELKTRAQCVLFVTEDNVEEIRNDNPNTEIESLIVPRLIQMHEDSLNFRK